MTNKIVIEGNMIRSITETVTAESPLSALTNHLTTRLPTIFPDLPSAGSTRYIGFDPTTERGLMIVETEPRTRSIRVYHGSNRNTQYPEDSQRADSEGVSTFRVTFPFTYFVFPFRVSATIPGSLVDFTIQSTGLLWRKEAYRPENPTFFVAECPNVDSGGGICWGGTITPEASLSQHIDAMINEFFTSNFNSDLGHRTPFGTSMTQWEEDSKTPLNYTNWPLWNSGRTMSIEDMWLSWTNGAPRMPMAEINPAFVDIPELPQEFTVLRAREWIEGLPERTRARFAAALQQAEESNT